MNNNSIADISRDPSHLLVSEALAYINISLAPASTSQFTDSASKPEGSLTGITNINLDYNTY